MEIIEKNHTSVSNKKIIQSHAISDRIFLATGSELLSEGHKVKFRAPGDSMYPTIQDGDLITVEPINPSDVIVGDIILYRHENNVVAHRVIRIDRFREKVPKNSVPSPQSSSLSPHHFYTLRGDAAQTCDDPVCADQILGKVTLVERNGRRIDPHSFRVKFLYKARRFASRLNRFLLFPRKLK